MALDFKAARLREFTALIALYGTTLTFNGKSYSCICPPKEQAKKMTNASYEEQTPITFQMLATDFTEAGITTRSTVAHLGKNYEVYSVVSDDKEASVELRTYLKQ